MKKLDKIATSLKVYFTLMKDMKTFHSYCDPMNMTPKDAERWRYYDKLIHPENYTAEELKNGM